MTEHQARAAALRSDPNVHYNCAQAVFVPFAEELGIPTEQAIATAAHFGAGMRMGSTCGAVTGALMALGLLGCGEPCARALLQEFQQLHGALDCDPLLMISEEAGLKKADHCNAMILKSVELVEKYRKFQ